MLPTCKPYVAHMQRTIFCDPMAKEHAENPYRNIVWGSFRTEFPRAVYALRVLGARVTLQVLQAWATCRSPVI